MPTPAADTDIYTQLRREAETRLATGTTPAINSYVIGVDALRLLHALSSDPDTAADALKLLHELQVHQVELDLQVAQIEATEHELAEELAMFRCAFEDAPFAYFLIDHQGDIIDGNHAGAELFGVSFAELKDRGLDSFLVPESRLRFIDLLKNLAEDGQSSEMCVAVINSDRPLQVSAKRAHDSAMILVACSPYRPASRG